MKRVLTDMRKQILKSDKNSINAMKLKEQETADASVLFQRLKQNKRKHKRISPKSIKNSSFSVLWRLWRVKLLFVLLFLVIGFGIGTYFTSSAKLFQNDKSVAIRVGTSQEHVDYDLLSAINFLKYALERNGYKVAGLTYSGNLYPKDLDNVGINVFVRGFAQFYDLRMHPEKIDIFYIHRNIDLYAEEFQNFDFYLFSQQKIMDISADKLDANFMPFGFVPHEILSPQSYDYDVLYIYEYYNPIYGSYMQHNHSIKIYSGSAFAALSEQERVDELKKAKVVVYEMGKIGRDDETYVPYAVFDIISYGRPLVTNRKFLLNTYFRNNTWLFDDNESMILATNQALNSADAVREKKAARARTVLYDFFDTNASFLKRIKQPQ